MKLFCKEIVSHGYCITPAWISWARPKEEPQRWRLTIRLPLFRYGVGTASWSFEECLGWWRHGFYIEGNGSRIVEKNLFEEYQHAYGEVP